MACIKICDVSECAHKDTDQTGMYTLSIDAAKVLEKAGADFEVPFDPEDICEDCLKEIIKNNPGLKEKLGTIVGTHVVTLEEMPDAEEL